MFLQAHIKNVALTSQLPVSTSKQVPFTEWFLPIQKYVAKMD